MNLKLKLSLVAPSALLLALASTASTGCSSTNAGASDAGGGGSNPPPSADAGGGQDDGGGGGGGSDAGDGGSTSTTLTLVDCKANTTDAKCPTTLRSDARIGKGPRLNLGRTQGGYVEGTKLVVALDLDDNLDDKSLIASVDLVTGERKALSGKYEDPSNGEVAIGSGPSLYLPYGIVKVADGIVVASSGPDGTISLLKVDPATGNRTALWSSDAAGRLSCGKLANKALISVSHEVGVAAGPSGEFYLGMEYPNDSFTLEGIARIKPDKTCEVVTLSRKVGGSSPDDVGSGPALYSNLRGNTFLNGAVWLITHDEYSLFRVDGAGKRTRVSSSYGATQVGDGDAEMGRNSFALDGTSNVVWTVGATNTGSLFITSVDLTNGNRTDRMATGSYGPVKGTSGGNPFVWTIPGSSYLAIEHGEATMVFDPATGNSNVVSY